jgi:hypothetical protein
MHRLHRLALNASLILALTVLPVAAFASTNVVYGVSGAEYFATTTVGSFAGVAVASDDFGAWRASVVHTALPTSVGGSAAITSGSFTLDGRARDLTGRFVSGWVTLLTTSSCGQQTFWVAGPLSLTSGGGGTADFASLLTHYRFSLFGRCFTYGATVKGTVTFHLS